MATCVAVAAGVTWWMKPDHQPDPPHESPTREPRVVSAPGGQQLLPAPEAVVAAALAIPAPPQEPPSIFAWESLPAPIQQAHDSSIRGDLLSVAQISAAAALARENPTDARPHLLIAADSMNHHWFQQATEAYLRAVRANPKAAREPRVLPDLLRVVAESEFQGLAGDLIARLYGPRALEAARAAEQSATAAGDETRAARLDALSKTLEAEPAEIR